MSYTIPLRQHGKMWGEIDPANYLLRIRRQGKTAVFDLRVLLAQEVQALQPVPERPPHRDDLAAMSMDEALETIKRVAAANPFNQAQHE